MQYVTELDQVKWAFAFHLERAKGSSDYPVLEKLLKPARFKNLTCHCNLKSHKKTEQCSVFLWPIKEFT